jgi:hypothetical protein
MRHSNHATRGKRRSDRTVGVAAPIVALVGLVLLVVIVVGCAPAAATSSSPTPLPTPVVTPDPHLKAPVTADQVWSAIAAGHMRLVPNNAMISEGTIVKRINADLEGWTFQITAYTNAAAMQKAKTWKPGQAPGVGEAPYTFSALNVMVEYGPTSRASGPPAADPEHQATAAMVIALLDPLLWPIEQHSVMAIPARTVPPASPSPAPSKVGKSPAPAKSKAP